MLNAKGYAYDGDTAQQAEHQVNHGNLPPAQQDPDEVHHNGQDARLIGTVHQLMAEGPEGVNPKLEQLHAKGNADDSNAHHKADDEVDDRNEDAAKNEPEYVTDGFHIMQTYEKLSIILLRWLTQNGSPLVFQAANKSITSILQAMCVKNTNFTDLY